MSIKLDDVVLASPEQMEFIIQGMRNPMNSWEKSDSHDCKQDGSFCMECECKNGYCLGNNDYSLMQRLSNAGTEHRKYMRMMPVYVRITAPLYWWKEFDTYKVGTVANSCSTMHKIAEKEFTMEDFSTEHLWPRTFNYFKSMINELNLWRRIYIEGYPEEFDKPEMKPKSKDVWWQMIQLLPSSYNQTRNVMLNYEVLANIYRQRKNHKLDEWREFCEWIETLPYSELITGGEERKLYSDTQVFAKTGQELKRGLRAGIGMVRSTAMEYLTDEDGEKIRDYLNIIEDQIHDLEKELSEFKKYFEPYDIDEETAEAIIRSKCPNIDSAKDYIQSRLAEDDPMNFSVGKVVHDLMAKELDEDIKKQILEGDSK